MKYFVAMVCVLVLCISSDSSAGAEQAGATGAGDAGQEGRHTCDVHNGPCTTELSGVRVTLDIKPKPVRAMTDLVFTVTLSGKKLSSGSTPYIDLGMPGMRMGPNRVHLASVGEGAYEGRGIIVRCPSGKRTWRAAVTIPGEGRAEFIFDVVY